MEYFFVLPTLNFFLISVWELFYLSSNKQNKTFQNKVRNTSGILEVCNTVLQFVEITLLATFFILFILFYFLFIYILFLEGVYL